MPTNPYKEIILDAAAEFEVEPCLIHAVIQVESAWIPDARSSCGACGLMQLMPGTFTETAKKLKIQVPAIFSPQHNIRCGTCYLRRQYDQFRVVGDVVERWHFALAAYNCGLGYIQLAMRLAEIKQQSFSRTWGIAKSYLYDEHCKIRGEDPEADDVIRYVDRVWVEYYRAKTLVIYPSKE